MTAAAPESGFDHRRLLPSGAGRPYVLVQGTGLPRPDAEAVNHDSDVQKLSVAAPSSCC